MRNVHAIVENLTRAQAKFLGAADAIAAEQWLVQPQPGRWSAGELVAHLCNVERGVLGYAGRTIRKTPLPVPWYKRLHLPLTLVRLRIIKRKVPAIVTPSTSLAGKETMLAELRGVRERTLGFLKETLHRDLSRYGWKHPFLGRLSFYAWFAFIADHQVRHSRQMWEIAQNLPKDVASS